MLIGRKKEQKRLLEAYESEYSEFVAVYGRRRVGKTFLIRETFGYKFTFQHSGLAKSTREVQLKAWNNSLSDYGLEQTTAPKSWLDAFELLKKLINKSSQKKKVIFIDELPWMDTRGSGLISALEHFWNSWASARKDVLLIVCGSATSWIINKIVKNRGGLHNRIDCKISLSPFSLKECEQYIKSRKIIMSPKQIVEGYMIMGGVPFYWKTLQKGLSLAQNIDNVFFAKEGELYDEFSALYESLFSNPEPYKKIVSLLASKRYGLTRCEIIKAGDFVDNGNLGQMLENLDNCGFIRSYNVVGKEKKDALYQLIDPFTIFYYEFIKENKSKDPLFWSHNLNTSLYKTWCGLSFERVCMLHIQQIKKALGISGIISNVYSWRSKMRKDGAQIDLVIDRNDGVVDLCEIKYTNSAWQMDSNDLDEIKHKEDIFALETKCSKAIHNVLISANGVCNNEYSADLQNVVTLKDLFVD